MARIPPHIISTFSRYSLGGLGLATAYGVAGATSLAWPAANRALFIPLHVDITFTIDKFIWDNRNSGTANADIGLYSDTGTRLLSTGSVALHGATGPQRTNVADYIVNPGRYYLAMAYAATSSMLMAAFSVTRLAEMGVYEQSSALPLPATATFVAITTNSLPLAGIIPKYP